MKGALVRADRGTDATASDEAPVTALVEDGDGGAFVSRPTVGRLRRPPAALRAGAPAWMWLGTLVAAAGFVLIAIGWGQVAGEVDVYRQLPYILSAGFVGLGFVLVGLAVLSIVSRQRDAIDRDRQVEQLIRVMDELKQVLSAEERRP